MSVRKDFYKKQQFKVFHHMCMALGPIGKNRHGQTEWLFECFEDGPGCEGEFAATISNVKNGTKSCGCHKRDDISGKIFYDSDGTLTCQALWYLNNDKKGKSEWLFRCLVNGPGCKYTFPALVDDVKRGKVRSCGCYSRLKASERLTTHGMSGTPEWQSYHAMHQRCYNPSNKYYYRYGGRGIKVEWEWHRDNPDGFANYLRNKGPITDPKKNTNDRLDNDANYGPKNDNGWQDRETQNRNQSTNVIDDLIEAELIRDLYNNGYDVNVLANAISTVKRKICTTQVISLCINEKTWKK